MLQTDLPVLNALKAIVEGSTFEETTLTDVYVAPDDFKLNFPELEAPFAAIGVMEDSTRELGYSTFGLQQASYSVYARFYLVNGEVLPTTQLFSSVEVMAREIFSVVGHQIFNNENLSGTVSESGNIINSLEYLIANTKRFTGCQIQMAISQEV